MVGRLARWLRVLGYDTIYNVSWTGVQIAEKARKENRVLLTRSVRLLKNNVDLKSLLIKQDKPWQQLIFVQERFNLGTEWIFSRCIECNIKVTPVSVDNAKEQVPFGVLQHSKKFYQCQKCQKIYWEGSHYKRFLEFLEKNHHFYK